MAGGIQRQKIQVDQPKTSTAFTPPPLAIQVLAFTGLVRLIDFQKLELQRDA